MEREGPVLTVTTWVETDSAALQGNLRALQELLAPGVAFQAVVKADAYGHGAVLAARSFLEAGAVSLGVATGEEALELRAAGIEAPVLLLTGLMGRRQEKELVQMGVELTVSSGEELRWASELAAAASSRARVHLKVDTGLGRLGVLWPSVGEVASCLRTAPGVEWRGLFTHLACADEDSPRGRAYTRLQNWRFRRVLEELAAAGMRPPCRHAANSAAILHYPELHYDMVRAGCALYGFYPTSRELESPIVQLAPCLHWRALILARGTSGQHGVPWALVGAGSMHGFPPRGHEVLVSGKRCQVLAVEPWRMFVDMTGVSESLPGVTATLLGRDGPGFLSPEEVAGWADTIHEELGCSLARLPHYHKGSAPGAGVDSSPRGGVK